MSAALLGAGAWQGRGFTVATLAAALMLCSVSLEGGTVVILGVTLGVTRLPPKYTTLYLCWFYVPSSVVGTSTDAMGANSKPNVRFLLSLWSGGTGDVWKVGAFTLFDIKSMDGTGHW